MISRHWMGARAKAHGADPFAAARCACGAEGSVGDCQLCLEGGWI